MVEDYLQKESSGYALQRIKFDDNISLTNEENNVSQSKKESFIFETEIYGKRDFSARKKYVISPDLRINVVQNSDQVSPEVYQNDSAIFSLGLKINMNTTSKLDRQALFLILIFKHIKRLGKNTFARLMRTLFHTPSEKDSRILFMVIVRLRRNIELIEVRTIVLAIIQFRCQLIKQLPY